MITQEQIQDVCRRIADEFHPDKIILFGSHAHGTPTEDSDLDVLVVMPFEGHPAYQDAWIRSRLNPHIPIDVLAHTPEQVRERLEMQDSFMREILNRGKVMYETHHA